MKYVDRPSDESMGKPDARLPILVAPQEESTWSYSAVVATINALSVKDTDGLNFGGRESIGAGELVEKLGKFDWPSHATCSVELAVIDSIIVKILGYCM